MIAAVIVAKETIMDAIAIKTTTAATTIATIIKETITTKKINVINAQYAASIDAIGIVQGVVDG